LADFWKRGLNEINTLFEGKENILWQLCVTCYPFPFIN
jgi:hypothetical protein